MINPSEFKDRTREQRQEFEWYKELAFRPTEQEVKQNQEYHINNLIQVTKWLLAPYGIDFTWKEKDFKKLWKQYIQWDKNSEKNRPMNEQLGKDERLQERVDIKSKDNNNLKDFCNFVIQYES
jgi:hypothetical protein